MNATRSEFPANRFGMAALGIFVGGTYLLPTLLPSIMGWLYSLLGLPVFFVLMAAGRKKGTVIIRNGLFLAGLCALLLERMEIFLFSLTMLPLGFTYQGCADRGESPASSGGRGVMVLVLSWLVFWVLLATLEEINPYRQLLALLDAGFASTYEMYAKEAELPLEYLLNLEETIHQIRAFLPRIMPGLIACMLVFTAWMNLVGSSRLLRTYWPERPGWPPYREWTLPDQLVWVAIIAGILSVLTDGFFQDMGISLLMLSGLLYCLQGFAVFLSFLYRWNTPLFLRLGLYILLLFQAYYSLLLLAIVGVADVWADFRKLNQTKKTPEQ